MTTDLEAKRIKEEIWLVLSLSLLPSVIYAVLSLASAPVKGKVIALYPQEALSLVQVLAQFTEKIFDFAPVWLVFYLVRRNGEELRTFGLDTARIGKEIAIGIASGLALLAVGALGYIAVLNLGIERTLLSAPPLGHWWGIPLVLLGSLGAGALEETVMVGYLLPRLRQLGWAVPVAVVASALFRGSYHLYQGPGGAIGAMAMGLVFGWAFIRWRRTWPLITAHFVYDAVGALLYASVKGHCLLSTCIR